MHLDPGGVATFAELCVVMTRVQGDTALRLRGVAQDPVEGRAPAEQHRRSPIGRVDDFSPSRRQIGNHIRHFGPQRVDHWSPKGVGVMELHHAFALPYPVRWRSGVAVDDDDVTAPPRQRDRDEETGWPSPDNDGSHALLQFKVIFSVMNTLRVT